jgi:hypothetical protein
MIQGAQLSKSRVNVFSRTVDEVTIADLKSAYCPLDIAVNDSTWPFLRGEDDWDKSQP